MNQFADGNFYAGVENDPMLSKESDEKLDLASLPDYKPGISKKKTFLSNEGRSVKTISEGADKYVKKMIKIAVETRERVRKRKLEAGEDLDDELTDNEEKKVARK